MSIKHVAPSRDALRTLRGLALGTVTNSTCVTSRKEPVLGTAQRRCQHTLWVNTFFRDRCSKRRERNLKPSRPGIQRYNYSSLATAQNPQHTDDPIPSPHSVADEGLLTEKQRAASEATRDRTVSNENTHQTPTTFNFTRSTLARDEKKVKIDEALSNSHAETPTYLSEINSLTADEPPQNAATAQPLDSPSSLEATRKARTRRCHSVSYLFPPFLSVECPLPPLLQKPQFESFADELSESESRRYFYICEWFITQSEDLGLTLCTRRLCKYLDLYIHSPKPQDWRLVKLVLQTWSWHFRLSLHHRLLEPSITALLNKRPPYLDAVAVLYVQKHYASGRSARLAERYLDGFCRVNKSLSTQIEQTRKVLDGTNLCGIPVSERLLYPIITDAVRNQTPNAALNLLKSFMDEYDIQPDARLLNTIAVGYVKLQDWSGYESLLSNTLSADPGIARRLPHTFNLLLRTGLLEFAAHHSAEEVFDFLTRHIQTYGVIPDNHLLRIVLQIFIKPKRFDLVQKWLRWKKSRFWLLHPISTDAIFAFQLSVIWHDSNASCIDILDTCSALAYGETQDPFSIQLRFLAEEAVYLDLHNRYTRLQNILERQSNAKSSFSGGSWRSLSARALQLIQSINSAKRNERAKLLAQDLEMQVKAVQSLATLFAGRYTTAAVAARLINTSNAQSNSSRSMGAEGGIPQWPSSIQGLHLSKRRKDLARETYQFYQRLQDEDIKPDSRVLPRAASRLALEVGPAEAYNFLRIMYASPWRNQHTWKVSAYSKWLEVASTWNHPSAVRQVLWEIITAPEYMRINNSLSVLVQIAVMRTHGRTADQVTAEEKAEVDYLIERVRRRHWIQNGRPSAAEIKDSRFPSWSLIPEPVDLQVTSPSS